MKSILISNLDENNECQTTFTSELYERAENFLNEQCLEIVYPNSAANLQSSKPDIQLVKLSQFISEVNGDQMLTNSHSTQKPSLLSRRIKAFRKE